MEEQKSVLPWIAKGGVTAASAAEMRARARRLLSSDKYLASLEKSLIDRTCPAAIEVMLHHYAFGKPPEAIELTVKQGQEDLHELSTDELLRRMQELQKVLEDAKALEQVLPAEFKVA